MTKIIFALFILIMSQAVFAGTWGDSPISCSPNPAANGTHVVCNVTYTCISGTCNRGTAGFHLQDDGLKINSTSCDNRNFLCNSITIDGSSTCGNVNPVNDTCRADYTSCGSQTTIVAVYAFTVCSGKGTLPYSDNLTAVMVDDNGAQDSTSFNESSVLGGITGLNVTLNTPSNKTFINLTSVTFNWTATDVNYNTLSCNLTIDSVLNTTGINSLNNTPVNKTISGFSNGIHSWNVTCSNNVTNAVTSLTNIFTVDSILPSISLNLPSNNTVNLSTSYTFNFTATDNLNTSMTCSLLIDGLVNQTNTSIQNNTLTNFVVSGFSEGNHTWDVRCGDGANTNTTTSLFFNVSVTPELSSITTSSSPIKGGDVITITAVSPNDPNNDTLNFYCDITSTPTGANTDCTGGTTIDTTPPYSLSCTFATTITDAANTVFCRVYDGVYYSTTRNTTYTTDSTPPTTTVANVANDSTLPYADKLNDGSTNITVNGESSMSCRFSASDIAYSSMTKDCTKSGTQALCLITTATQGSYSYYVSCQDSLGNEQNSTTNLDVGFTLDYTAPTTSDSSSSAIQTPGYNVTITEADNIDGDPTTLYCTDTTNTCSPNTAIDTGGNVQFNSRGTYYLRYNSTDYAGNQQTTVSKTININQLPTFTSASGTTGTVKGGSTLNVTTISSSVDINQNITLFVCKTNSANYTGCVSTYCSVNATGNATCTFIAESDDTTHTWYAFIFDQSNESAVANSRSGTYTTDSTGPTISILSPTNNTYTQGNVTAIITMNEAASNASYSLNGAPNVSMTSISPTAWTIDLTDLSDSSHTLIFYANDTVGNNAAEKNVSFTISAVPADTTPPSITVTSPVSNTYYSTQTIFLNISLNENGTWSGYRLDDNNLTSLDNTSNRNWNTTLIVAQGSHNITFFANDTSNNHGNTTISFFVDVSAPQFSSVIVDPNPANQSQAVTCSAFWIDAFNITSASVEENSSGIFENHTVTISGSSGWTNYTIVGAKLSNVGSYACNFYVTDIAGNSNSTSTSFTVQDLIAPAITITSTTNTSYSQNDMALQIVSSETLLTAYYCLDACTSNTTMTNTSATLWQASPTIASGSHTIILDR